ncbi:F-box domain containing protein [Zea mays]|uniref:F-box domain containing protein n=1 Tax=Zea mays TaxID=4577 RepID=A0A1D6KPL7_MAIZE|nr:F-box domain containing protein [Zea mays]ONM04748.1 F-box domain containing protein [Zea mays]|eukprot:NP_001149164.2 F-box domain containing protein [Zea mays]
MASHPEHPAEPRAPPAPTTIGDLSDDLLREILLRLPSLPSLVCASLSCRAFLAAVRSSRTFRRRFRALHPPPLLGFFFDPDGNENPTFMPIRRGSDRGHAAAVRGLDAFLTRVPHEDDVFPGWQIMECRGGCLLLLNWRTKQLAAYNPLTGALDLVPKLPDDICKGHRGKFISGDFFLVVPDDEAPDRRSFRVVSSCHDKYRVRVAVFSSATRKWQILPWSEPVPTQPASGKYWLLSGRQVSGFLCWSHHKNAYKVLLDTATLQFSVIDLPYGLSGQGHLYRTGDTKDGKLCIVAAIDFSLFVWFRTPDAGGIDRWVLRHVLQLEDEVLEATEGSRNELEQLKVFAILDGIVYMTTFETFRDATLPCWYLSFCLETRKLEKLFYVKANGHAHPYFMPWPTALVGNNLSP